MDRGPYSEVLSLLNANPNWEVYGSVEDVSGHYVHYNSTRVELQSEGDMESEDPAALEAASASVAKLEAALQDQVRTWNRELEKQLYSSLEAAQSDETLTDWMEANEWRFDDEGNRIDMSKFMPVDNLQPGIRDRVLKEYADLFDRTPEQVYTALMQRNYRFDKRGNRVDVSQFVQVSDLEDGVRKEVLEKYRNLLTEDNGWAEPDEDDWKERLQHYGFGMVSIRYSLGYSQGDGASFTAKGIDVKKLCSEMVKEQRTKATAESLVTCLIA